MGCFQSVDSKARESESPARRAYGSVETYLYRCSKSTHGSLQSSVAKIKLPTGPRVFTRSPMASHWMVCNEFGLPPTPVPSVLANRDTEIVNMSDLRWLVQEFERTPRISEHNQSLRTSDISAVSERHY